MDRTGGDRLPRTNRRRETNVNERLVKLPFVEGKKSVTKTTIKLINLIHTIVN